MNGFIELGNILAIVTMRTSIMIEIKKILICKCLIHFSLEHCSTMWYNIFKERRDFYEYNYSEIEQ